MSIFNFFKKSKKENSIDDEIPSFEQTIFAEIALEILTTTIEKYSFILTKTEIKKYSTNIVWRKENQYIKVSSTNYPTDYPYFYNLEFGEGSSEDFFEYDWNSIALWKFVNNLDKKKKAQEYKFPIETEVRQSLKNANKELEKYAISFLQGDLKLFYELRSEQNKNREPYKVYKQNSDGKYIVETEQNSLKQKNKFN